MSVDSLRAALRRLDGGSYGALKSLVGSYAWRGHRLVIDWVQSDPYAPPSRIRVLVPLAATELPADLLGTVEDRRAVRDFIARDIADAVAQGPREFGFVAPGQEIVDRSSVVFTGDWVELRLTFAFSAAGRRVTGMGIRQGVTVLMGGGFHGKSTLLAALGLGVYPHVPGDGRELVVTAASAVAVRAEDGRAVTSLDISAFIRDFPTGQDKRRFSTANASGSTS